MSDFMQAVNRLLQEESGELIPDDNGRGPSKWGVTLATAREIYPHATADDIARLDRDGAITFYRADFWERYHIGRIMDQQLAYKVFDFAVNQGPTTAIKLLQRAAGVDDDGILGDTTANAVNKGNPAVILSDLRAEAKQHYRNIVAARPEREKDLQGWLARADA